MYVDWSLIANSGVALATLALARFTYSLARSTKRLAEETRRERELEFQPYLLLQHEGYDSSYVIYNVGRGPALNCRYCFEYPDDLAPSGGLPNPWASDPTDLPPAEKMEDLPVAYGTQDPWIHDVLRGLPIGTTSRDSGRRYAVVCEDQFGALYRFCPVAGESKPDTWRVGQHPVPHWIYWPPRSKPPT